MKKRVKIDYKKRISLTNPQKNYFLKNAESIIANSFDINGIRRKFEKEIEELLRLKIVNLL